MLSAKSLSNFLDSRTKNKENSISFPTDCNLTDDFCNYLSIEPLSMSLQYAMQNTIINHNLIGYAIDYFVRYQEISKKMDLEQLLDQHYILRMLPIKLGILSYSNLFLKPRKETVASNEYYKMVDECSYFMWENGYINLNDYLNLYIFNQNKTKIMMYSCGHKKAKCNDQCCRFFSNQLSYKLIDINYSYM